MVGPFYEIGKMAVSNLIDKIEGRKKNQELIELPSELILGASTAPVKSSKIEHRTFNFEVQTISD